MIYVVEDDDNIRELVCYTLTSLNYQVTGFPDAQSLEPALRQQLPELLILDLMLPVKDGLTILKELRAAIATSELPILILSAKASEFDKVTGLNLGADDYLVKPFGAMELVARVKALLRRSSRPHAPGAAAIRLGPLLFQPAAHEFTLAEKPLVLTQKEFALLQLFVENPKTAFSRDHLLDAVWGYQYDGENRTVDVHIGTLRQKLGRFGEAIETIRGFGYRLQPGALGENDAKKNF